MLTSLALSALGLVGATELLAARRDARAAKLQPPLGQDVEVEGARVHVQVMGEGPDLVLIHGSSGNTRDFTLALAPELARRYRVFIVDRPGLGWSDRTPETDGLEAQARLIQKAVAQLGAAKPIVLGQSYGGSVALTWAATRPGTLSALVLVSAPAYPWSTGLGAYYTVLSHPIGQALLIPMMSAFVPRPLFAYEIDKVFRPQRPPEGYAAHFGPDITLRRAVQRANAMQRKVLLSEITRLSPRWAEIDLPIEILHGTADHIVAHDIHSVRLADENRNAVLTSLPGIGHMPHHVSRPFVVAAIDRAALRADVK